MARFLGCVAFLLAAFLALHFQAVHGWGWGLLQPAVAVAYRLSEVACLPFGLPALAISNPMDQHFPPAFYVLRAGFAAFGFVALAAAAAWWRAPSPRVGLGGVTRRDLLLAGPTAAAAGLAVYAVGVEPARLQVRRFEIALQGLPRELDGLRLGHVTDTHHGPYVTAEFIEAAVRRVAEESPDLLLLTGDFVHRTPAAIPRGIQALAAGQARLGSVAVLGNHDHWEGAEQVRSELRARGIRLLDNDRVFLERGGVSEAPTAGALALCGVGDLWTDEVLPRRALRGVPEGMVRIVLSHNPDVAELLPAASPEVRFDLQISGHTHGGQIVVPGYGPPAVPSRYGQKYARGLVKGPAWPVLVSAGVGMTVVPVRFGVPPEVGLVVLRRA